MEEITITNSDGAWTGYAMGNYTYPENLPDGAASQDVVIFGEWHFVGSGAHDGLQLDFYSANDVGLIGTIHPIPEAE